MDFSRFAADGITPIGCGVSRRAAVVVILILLAHLGLTESGAERWRWDGMIGGELSTPGDRII